MTKKFLENSPGLVHEIDFTKLNKKDKKLNIEERLENLSAIWSNHIMNRNKNRNVRIALSSVKISSDLSSAEVILISWEKEKVKICEEEGFPLNKYLEVSRNRWTVNIEILTDGSFHILGNFDAKLPNETVIRD